MKRSRKETKRKITVGDDGDYKADDAGDEVGGWMWASGKVDVWPSRSRAHMDAAALETLG